MVQLSGGARDFCLFQKHPNWLWGPPSLLHGGYWGLFLLGFGSWIMKLTTDLCLVLRCQMRRSVYSLSQCLHGMHKNNFTYTFKTDVTAVMTVYIQVKIYPCLQSLKLHSFQKGGWVGVGGVKHALNFSLWE
jgi:hypothetical protein